MSSTPVPAVSGTQSGTTDAITLQAGDVITITYTKDGSGNNGDDCATFKVIEQ